jgi:hypothetical protein
VCKKRWTVAKRFATFGQHFIVFAQDRASPEHNPDESVNQDIKPALKKKPAYVTCLIAGAVTHFKIET